MIDVCSNVIMDFQDTMVSAHHVSHLVSIVLCPLSHANHVLMDNYCMVCLVLAVALIKLC
jgi:hypothetical protein